MNTMSKEYKTQFQNDILPPPPPYSTPSGFQAFPVNYIDWKHNIYISDSAGQALFTARGGSCSSTRLEFTNRSGQIIGRTKRSNLSSKIDVEIQDATGVSRNFEMHNSASVLGGSPKYNSPAFGGMVTWKNSAMSRRIIYTLIDERGVALAKFESDPCTRIGRLELTDAVAGEDRLNELAITLLTLLQRKMKNIQQANYAALT